MVAIGSWPAYKFKPGSKIGLPPPPKFDVFLSSLISHSLLMIMNEVACLGHIEGSNDKLLTLSHLILQLIKIKEQVRPLSSNHSA